jgi:hypothetical protein
MARQGAKTQWGPGAMSTLGVDMRRCRHIRRSWCSQFAMLLARHIAFREPIQCCYDKPGAMSTLAVGMQHCRPFCLLMARQGAKTQRGLDRGFLITNPFLARTDFLNRGIRKNTVLCVLAPLRALPKERNRRAGCHARRGRAPSWRLGRNLALPGAVSLRF